MSALLSAWAFAAGAVLAAPSAQPKLQDLQDLPDRLHVEGVAEFRVARFSAAYGRFVRSADLGHPPSAHYALWMCRNGWELFGKDWDCTGEQLHDWAQLIGVPTPPLVARHYRRYTVPAGRPIDAVPGTSSTTHLPGVVPSRSGVSRPHR
ncbi:MAG TPA: hypothetical protein VEZ89_16865 [Rubrivivax sp.]|nr:hypothetical protein [Rubrivivax sp.]